MLLMEQIQMIQTQNNNLLQLGMEQLQKISILVINILLRIPKREQDQNLIRQNNRLSILNKGEKTLLHGLQESFPMTTRLDIGNQFIYNVKTPTNNNQATNKEYVDGKLTKKANLGLVQNVMRQVTYKADKLDLDNYLQRDGSLDMTGNLQMNTSKIKGLPLTTPQSGDEATSKDYVLTSINDVPNVYLDRAGSLKMTGDLDMDNNRIKNLNDERQTGTDAINKNYVFFYSVVRKSHIKPSHKNKISLI